MQRWVLIRDGLVRCYLLTEGEPDEATKHSVIFGDAAPDPLLAPDGDWREVPDEAGLVGDGWRLAQDGQFLPPEDARTLPRTVSGAGFLALFSAAEVAAMWQAGPEFMVAALRIAAQNEVNLNSLDLGRLLGLAVTRGALSAERVSRIAAGLPPT